MTKDKSRRQAPSSQQAQSGKKSTADKNAKAAKNSDQTSAKQVQTYLPTANPPKKNGLLLVSSILFWLTCIAALAYLATR